VRHGEAWTRLPDLLDDRDDAALLAHVRACADCQRQLFLLGRVDRLLRERASTEMATRTRWLSPRRLLASAAAVAGAAAVVLALLLSQRGGTQGTVLRMASGHAVGRAVMAHSDARNVALALTARGLPVDRAQIFVLWAADNTRAPMQVGRFMVDRSGGCRVRINLPATHTWSRFGSRDRGAPPHHATGEPRRDRREHVKQSVAPRSFLATPR
jgi:anti-sigma-K factor RskA